VGRLFAAQTRASGRVPQISVVLGPAAGGAAYGPALTDVVVMGSSGRVFVTGPDVVRRVTGEQVDMERLGGPGTHARTSGVAHVAAPTDDEALYTARRLAVLLGQQALPAPLEEAVDPGPLVPSDPRHSYDVRPVLRAVLDPGSYLELHREWATSAVTMLGRLGGRTVGVVANDPQVMAGCLDAATGDKTGRFVQWCDGMGLPLVFVVDVPGYLPGVSQEDEGVLRRGAKLLHAYAGATVPRLTVITRKAYGGAFIAMGSKGLGADRVLAWPGAQVDVMGATAAVEVLDRRELAAEKDPAARAQLVLRLAAQHEATTGGLTRALECGAVDEVIEPSQTRARLLAALAELPDKRGTRPNGPL
jgi:acetyl-CoA/propionyl-CoA carboxylase carboxyl transferase subunit